MIDTRNLHFFHFFRMKASEAAKEVAYLKEEIHRLHNAIEVLQSDRNIDKLKLNELEKTTAASATLAELKDRLAELLTIENAKAIPQAISDTAMRVFDVLSIVAAPLVKEARETYNETVLAPKKKSKKSAVRISKQNSRSSSAFDALSVSEYSENRPGGLNLSSRKIFL